MTRHSDTNGLDLMGAAADKSVDGKAAAQAVDTKQKAVEVASALVSIAPEGDLKKKAQEALAKISNASTPEQIKDAAKDVNRTAADVKTEAEGGIMALLNRRYGPLTVMQYGIGAAVVGVGVYLVKRKG